MVRRGYFEDSKRLYFCAASSLLQHLEFSGDRWLLRGFVPLVHEDHDGRSCQFRAVELVTALCGVRTTISRKIDDTPEK